MRCSGDPLPSRRRWRHSRERPERSAPPCMPCLHSLPIHAAGKLVLQKLRERPEFADVKGLVRCAGSLAVALTGTGMKACFAAQPCKSHGLDHHIDAALPATFSSLQAAGAGGGAGRGRGGGRCAEPRIMAERVGGLHPPGHPHLRCAQDAAHTQPR